MTYPVDRIAIQQFRGLKNLTLEGLGRINLLVGENDAGKTSVLEAIAVYCQPLDLLRWLDLAQRRDVKGQLSQSQTLQWLFPKFATSDEHGQMQIAGSGAEGNVEFVATVEQLQSTQANSKVFLERIFDTLAGTSRLLSGDSAKDDHGKWGDFIERASSRMPLLGGVRIRQFLRLRDAKPQQIQTDVWPLEPLTEVVAKRPGPPVKLLSPFTHRLESLQLDLLSDATRGNLREEVTEAVRLMNPSVRALEILTVDGIAQLHIRHSERGLLPISLFGDGVRRTLTYALALAEVRGGVLLIDELETAIHASVLGPIFAWLLMACRRFNVQLFATTHSLEAVDAVLGACEKEQLSEVVAYRLSADRVKRFSGELLHGMRTDMGLDIRGGR